MSRRPTLAMTDRGRDRLTAASLFVALMLAYNSNGREIGSYDTQPTKFAARELLLRGTLALDYVVGATPEYAQRGGFIHAADGRYRSVYSPVPALAAVVIVWPLYQTGILDIRAPLAPSLIAKLAASVLVSIGVVLAFFTARQRLSRRRALLLAIGLGLGTGFWSTSSQTLWQTGTAAVGLAIAVFAFAAPHAEISGLGAVTIGLGLGLAGTARPQVGPIIAVVLAGTCARSKPRVAIGAISLVALCGAVLCATNLRWFGHPLGGLVLVQDLNSQVHATGATFGLHLEGFAGLLLSPSRGLLIFSPVVLVAVAGFRQSLAEGWRSPLPWCLLALAAEYALYGSFAVWWGGHTYGPRYLLDGLPVAVPLAAVAMAPPRIGRVAKAGALAALAWSMLVAATGAFCYPNDLWNVYPADIDRNHSRLWSVSDSQIVRCWRRGFSPQNFSLIDRAAIRKTPG
jgi:hypothetical protein